jgi:hypothetical protein
MDEERGQFRAYLLGALPEAEAAEFDEQLFKRDDVLRRMEDEQQMLIDESAKGLLSGEEESRFRAQCSRSPQLQRNLLEVEALIATLQTRSARTRRQGTTGFWLRFFALLSPALAVALCVTAFLYVQQRRMNETSRNRPDSGPMALAAPSVPLPPMAEGKQFVAFLAANVVRGDTSMPRLVIPKAASAVELQVEVHGADVGDDVWHVNISEDGRPVWTSARVPMHRLGAETYLDLHLDTGVLTPGAYSMQLGSSADLQSQQTRQFIVAWGK